MDFLNGQQHFYKTEVNLPEPSREVKRTMERTILAILENADMGIYTLDTDFCYTTFNQAHAITVKQLYGFEIAVGKKAFGYMGMDWSESKDWESIYKEAAEGKAQKIDRGYSRSGQVLYFTYDIRPVVENGVITGLTGFVYDLTKQKLAEDRLQVVREQRRFLAQNPLMGICWVSAEGKLMITNDAFCNLLGYTKLQLIDKHPTFFTHADDVLEQEEAAYRVLTGQFERICQQVRFVTCDKSVITCEVAFQVVKGIDNTPRAYVMQVTAIAESVAPAATDIVELVNAKVAEKTAELLEANTSLKEFGAMVTHDLQAPLRNLAGFTKILELDHAAQLSDDGKNIVQILNSNVMAMSHLVRDLFAFSKMSLAEIRREQVDMESLVKKTVEGFRFEKERFNTNIVLGPLKPACGDAGLLQQVWSNLIDNAIKYSSKKEQPLVEIGMTDAGGVDVYYIKDNGAGFDMEYSSGLFEIFKRLHNSGEFEGTGVGLASAHRIITKHGGVVWAEAAPDAGACFYFTLGN